LTTTGRLNAPALSGSGSGIPRWSTGADGGPTAEWAPSCRRIVRAAILRACTAFCGWCVWRPAICAFRPAGGACLGRPKWQILLDCGLGAHARRMGLSFRYTLLTVWANIRVCFANSAGICLSWVYTCDRLQHSSTFGISTSRHCSEDRLSTIAMQEIFRKYSAKCFAIWLLEGSMLIPLFPECAYEEFYRLGAGNYESDDSLDLRHLDGS
jgi:hypothetical protein